VQGAWLLLADIHIESSKVDLAQPLLKQVLVHNKVPDSPIRPFSHVVLRARLGVHGLYHGEGAVLCERG
jgi:hypothetical protein